MATNIQHYIAFITAIEYGSFTKAAEILKYSHSGISRSIQNLEKEWNVVLLERGKKGVQLTSDGIRLLPYIRNICQDYQRLQTQIDEINGLQSGIIRIGTFTSVASLWLPNILTSFCRDYPNIDYELLLGDYEEIESWLMEGRVDCGFLRLPTHSDLDVLSLEQDELMVVMPKNHPLSEYPVVPMELLGKYPFLLLEKNDNTEISDIFRQNNISPDIHVTTWDDYAILSLVESGFGITILPKLILKRIPYNVTMKSMEKSVYRNIGLAMRDFKSASLAVRRFLDYVQYRNKC